MNTTRTLAFVAALALIGGILGVPAAAQNDEVPDEERPGNDARDPQERRQDMRDRQEERRQDARERIDHRAEDRDGRPDHGPEDRQARLRAVYEERCGADAHETDGRCAQARDVDAPAAKARRAAHALTGAIAATERQIDRFESIEDRLRARLADDNTTGEDAAAIEHRLDKVVALQDRLDARLLGLQERLERLHGKWDEVRAHVAEKRRDGELQEPTCEETRDRRSDRIEARHASGLSAAEARRDRVLAQENLTEEQRERVWNAYNGTLATLEGAYETAQERVATAYGRCLERGSAGSEGIDAQRGSEGADDGADSRADGGSFPDDA